MLAILLRVKLYYMKKKHWPEFSKRLETVWKCKHATFVSLSWLSRELTTQRSGIEAPLGATNFSIMIDTSQRAKSGSVVYNSWLMWGCSQLLVNKRLVLMNPVMSVCGLSSVIICPSGNQCWLPAFNQSIKQTNKEPTLSYRLATLADKLCTHVTVLTLHILPGNPSRGLLI